MAGLFIAPLKTSRNIKEVEKCLIKYWQKRPGRINYLEYNQSVICIEKELAGLLKMLVIGHFYRKLHLALSFRRSFCKYRHITKEEEDAEIVELIQNNNRTRFVVNNNFNEPTYHFTSPNGNHLKN